jgi:hypothetical protein
MKPWWQLYKELELIPDAVQEPQADSPSVAATVRRFWRSLLTFLTQEPIDDSIDEHRIEMLERCFALDMTKPQPAGIKGIWQKLQSFLDGLWLENESGILREPEIWQSLGRDGHLWWHVYDPVTGRIVDMGTEEEVRIWLEERLY